MLVVAANTAFGSLNRSQQKEPDVSRTAWLRIARRQPARLVKTAT
jgi:hypothetical protein